jgi:KaiC/GvpD/RAD55 family RecA-like ATPase
VGHFFIRGGIMNMEYVRISTGLNSYKLYPLDENFNLFDVIDVDADQDYYRGVYKYEKKHYDYWKKTGSLSGIKDVKTDCLLFDFDSDDKKGVSFDDARASALKVINQLGKLGMPRDYIHMYFSGSKGFHIQINVDEKITREEFENIVFNIAQDLPGFDKSVRDQQRLIRIEFTKRKTSKCRKIPITVEQLKTVSKENLKKLSLNDTDEMHDLYESWDACLPLSDELVKLKNTPYKKVEEPKVEPIIKSDNNTQTKTLNLKDKPDWIDPARYALLEGFFESPNRNHSFCILATFLRKHKFTKEQTISWLDITLDKQAKRYNVEPFPKHELLRNCIGWAYGPNWNGGIFGKEDEIIQAKINEFNLHSFYNQSTGPMRFTDVIEEEFETIQDPSNRVLTGFTSIDNDLVINKKEIVSIIGAPSSGKTTFTNQLIKNMAYAGNIVLYESLDMTKTSQVIRMLNHHSENPMTRVELWEMANRGEDFSFLVEAKEKAKKAMGNVFICDVETDVNSIINHAYELEQRPDVGKLPDVIVIDYLEQISSSADDGFMRYNKIFEEFSEFCKHKGILGIMLLQPNKRGADNDKIDIDMPINRDGIKYGGKITQNSRVIWSVCRPGARSKNKEDDKYMQIDSIKVNDGPHNTYLFRFDGVKAAITEASPEDSKQLAAIKRKKSQDKVDDLFD